MPQHRTRKQKETPHYQFLVSWHPKDNSQARVKGESVLQEKTITPAHSHTKNANLLAKDDTSGKIKKDIIKSLIVVSFILILEMVVYLALYRV